MDDYLVNIAGSVRVILVTALALTLSLGAWGRLALRLLRLDPDPAYGRPLTTTAGAAVVAMAGYLVFPWVRAYEPFLRVWYLLGLALFAGELLFVRLPRFLRAPDKRAFLAAWPGRHGSLLAMAALAAILAAFHSAMWPSGKPVLWLFTNGDCYLKSFLVDYRLGLVRPEAFSLTGSFYLFPFETFGTQMVAGLAAVADGRSGTFSISFFFITLLAWSGTSIHSMARSGFGLGWAAALVAALGVVGGSFYTYLFFEGQNSQLVAMAAFLAAMDRALAEPFGDRADPRAWGRILIPVFLMFLAYPATFALQMTVLGLARAISAFFRVPGRPVPWRKPERFGWRLAKAFCAGLWMSATLALGCCLLAPWQAWYSMKWFFIAVAPSPGWTLPPLGSRLFVGLPWYPEGFFFGMAPASLAGWAAWFALVGLMAGLAVRRGRKTAAAGGTLAGEGDARPAGPSSGGPDASAMAALTGTLILTALAYLVVLRVSGNSYQLWKFASLAPLTLSFVPLCLAIGLASGSVARLAGDGVRRGAWQAFLAVFLMAGTFAATVPRHMTVLPWNVFRLGPARGFLEAMVDIRREYQEGRRIFFDFYDQNLIYLAASPYQRQSAREFVTIKAHHIFDPKYNFDLALEAFDDYVVVSDQDYPGLFLGRRPRFNMNTIAVKDKAWFEENGRVAWSGVNMPIIWAVAGDWLSVRVTKPVGMVATPARLSFRLSAAPSSPDDCDPALSLAFLEDGPRVWSAPSQGLMVEAELPPSLTAAKTFRAAVRITVSPKYGRPGVHAVCSYRAEAVDLAPVSAASSHQTSLGLVPPDMPAPSDGADGAHAG